MILTNYMTRQAVEINADAVLEIHDRGPYREIKIGMEGICEAEYIIIESVPEIMDKIREEKTS